MHHVNYKTDASLFTYVIILRHFKYLFSLIFGMKILPACMYVDHIHSVPAGTRREIFGSLEMKATYKVNGGNKFQVL